MNMHSAMKEYNSMPQPCGEIRQTVQHGTDFSPEAKDQIRCNKSGISFKVAKVIFIGEAGVGKTSLGKFTRLVKPQELLSLVKSKLK